MPKKLLFRPGGQLVFEDPGKPVFNNFITGTTTISPDPTTTTIPTTGISSCAGGDPEMYLTLLDSDYSDGSGNITWCGETWTPAEIRTGTVKGPVCPSHYVKGRDTGYAYAPQTTAQVQWAKNGNSLNLFRLYWKSTTYFGYPTNRRRAWNRLYVNNGVTLKKDYVEFVSYTWAPYPGPNSPWYTFPFNLYNQVGLVGNPTVVGPPTFNNYDLIANFFTPYITGLGKGTGVDINGVSYYWQKGNGW